LTAVVFQRLRETAVAGSSARQRLKDRLVSTEESRMARICVVDDNELMRQSVTTALERDEHQVTAFRDAASAMAAIFGPPAFDVIVSDLKMPGMDGIEFLRQLRERQVETPLILMTAFASVPTAVQAMKLGAFDYLQKPFEVDELVVLVERAIQMTRLRSE